MRHSNSSEFIEPWQCSFRFSFWHSLIVFEFRLFFMPKKKNCKTKKTHRQNIHFYLLLLVMVVVLIQWTRYSIDSQFRIILIINWIVKRATITHTTTHPYEMKHGFKANETTSQKSSEKKQTTRIKANFRIICFWDLFIHFHCPFFPSHSKYVFKLNDNHRCSTCKIFLEFYMLFIEIHELLMASLFSMLVSR